MNPSELCERLRAEQDGTPEIAVFMIDDPVAMKVAVAWSQIPPAWKKGKAASLDALWRLRKVDIGEVERRSGLRKDWVDRAFEALKAARLIFPDGSLSRWAMAVIRAHIAHATGARAKR